MRAGGEGQRGLEKISVACRTFISHAQRHVFNVREKKYFVYVWRTLVLVAFRALLLISRELDVYCLKNVGVCCLESVWRLLPEEC